MPPTGNKRFDLASYFKAQKEACDKQAKELKRIERLEKKVPYVIRLSIILPYTWTD